MSGKGPVKLRERDGPKEHFITARKRSLGQGNIFTPVCHSVHRGGVRGFIWGACVVLFGGACVVLFGGACVVLLGACVVLFGGCMVLFRGACMVLLGGMRGFIRGACVVLFGGGHAWFYSGGCAWFFQFFWIQ